MVRRNYFIVESTYVPSFHNISSYYYYADILAENDNFVESRIVTSHHAQLLPLIWRKP